MLAHPNPMGMGTFVLCGLVSAHTLAQAATDVVITGTRTPESASRASIRTDVVSTAEAERRGSTSVADALTSQPGVVVNPSAYSGLGGISAIQIQGLDRDRVLILEDGERIIGDTGGAIDLSSIPISDLARIEIVQGPMSSLYGSSALGGVINLITSPPNRQGFSALTRAEARSRLGFFFTSNATYRNQSTWLGLNGSYFQQEGIRPFPNSENTTVPDIRRGMVALRGGFALSPTCDARLRVRWLHNHSYSAETTQIPGLGHYKVNLPDNADRYTAHMVINHKFGNGSSLRTTVGSQHFIGSSNKNYQGSPQSENRDRHDRMQSIEMVGTIAQGPRTWVLGARGETEQFYQNLTKVTPAPEGLITSKEPEVAPTLLGTIAAYGQITWKFGPFTVLPGLRTEAYRQFGSSITPRIAFAFRSNDDVLIRAGVGRGFRTPSAKELGFLFDHSYYGYKVVGNPNLSPESSLGTNADATLFPLGQSTFRIGGFANWINNMIDVDLRNASTENGVAVYQYNNFSKAQTAGLQLSWVYHLSSRIRSEISYDYLWTWNNLTAEPLSGRPPHSVAFSSLINLPAGLQWYARGRVFSDAYVNREVRSPGWLALDTRIARVFWQGTELYAGIINALNIHQDYGRVGDLRPLEGRTFYLGIRAELPWENET